LRIDTSVEDNESISDLSVYPNPTNNVIKVATNNVIKKLELYNSNGQLLKSINNSNEIDLNEFTVGVYWLKVIMDNSSETKKIVKK
jgi:hypothetical protein